MAFHELPGISLSEVSPSELDVLWLRGGFPRSFTAGGDEESFEWRANFAQTFLERDLPQLGITIGSGTLARFW